jgi:inosine-uridine nucleoside N-ribohydrolase
MRHRCIRAVVLALAVALCGHARVAASQPDPRALIIDTDAGHDDLLAIAYLLTRRDIRVEAVTIAFGLAHQEPGALNIQRLLDVAQRSDVPVYLGRSAPAGIGNSFPAEWRERADAMTGIGLPPPQRQPRPQSAAAFLSARLRDRSRPVDVLALGALTNLADAVGEGEPLAALRSLVIMGGAVRVAGNVTPAGQSKAVAEWNIFADPGAARQVLSSGVPALLVPLDATNDVPIGAEFIATAKQRATSPLGRVVSDVLSSVEARASAGHYYAWDPLAAVALIDRSVVRTEQMRLMVRPDGTEQGRLIIAPAGASIEVAVGADPVRFRQAFLVAFEK